MMSNMASLLKFLGVPVALVRQMPVLVLALALALI
jgi:hypothetical protein